MSSSADNEIVKTSFARSEFQFTVLPKYTQVYEGESVVLKCRAFFDDEIDFSWTLNGNPIRPDHRVFLNGSNLHINSVSQRLDSGDYVCLATAESSGARVATPPAKLEVIRTSTPVVQLMKHESEKGGSIVLKCHIGNGSSSGAARDEDEFRIEWYRNNERLTKSAHIDFQRRKLHIKNATAKDNGVYSCRIVRRAATGIPNLQPEAVASVKNYRLKLKATSAVPASWSSVAAATGGGHRADNTYGIDCTKSQNSLLCRGKRGDKPMAAALTASVSSSSFVSALTTAAAAADNLALPLVQIVDHPANAVVNESAPAVFNCGFQALPNETAVIVKWRKDGKVIRKWDSGFGDLMDGGGDGVTESSMFRDDARIHVDRVNGSLVFNSVIASDEGSYDCQITNNGTEFLVTSNTAELQIISNLRFTPKPPTTRNLELGSVAKIHCKAQGTPAPAVHWLTEAGRTELPESVEDVNGTLIFRTVTTDHRGNYTCVASNSQGEISASVVVNVVVAPKFEVAPEGSMQVAEMGTVHIHCVATGDPKPTIQWDKDLQYLHSSNQSEENRYRILDNGTLMLSEVHLEDDGKYGCTIGNSAGLKREEVHLIVRPADSMPLPEETPEDGFLITRAVLITMSVAFAYIILVVGLMLWCRHRRAARKARLNMSSKENGDVDLKNCEIEPCLPEKSSQEAKSKPSKKSGHQKNGSTADGQDKSDDTVNSTKSKKSSGSSGYLEQLSVPRTSVIDTLQIGKCDFGDVFIGKIKENDCRTATVKEETSREPVAGDEVVHGDKVGVAIEDEKITKKPSNEELNEIKLENDYKPVMVKALTKVKDEHCCSEFRRQLELFRTVSHKNVVKLFGLCRDKDPHYLLLEYTDWGDLKQFLLATAPNSSPNGSVESKSTTAKPPPLNVPQTLALAHQIGRGMDAIYKARIIHKDLATRNCIISSDFSAKISLPALSRDKYSKEYFKFKNQLLPVRWMAPECLQDDDYSIKSDIFSFAVLVWELFTQATELPFKDLSEEEYVTQAQAGKLEWKVAEKTPEALHKILTSCWSLSPKERPSFSQLVVAIGNCLQSEYPKEPTEMTV
ncbi:tyrosine-protein kinase-like otk isoform X2 [Wyeomyia smithii]|uniref:tyrosine-protein kinase-like otk isoform X2 n=1 Tax=Wyeomyia smithii TaxID=174621 RepID=UPI00246804E3|nr:tyrosine-protein kinase-like otk isoform X2 [Wyeomyia smithii]